MILRDGDQCHLEVSSLRNRADFDLDGDDDAGISQGCLSGDTMGRDLYHKSEERATLLSDS